MCWTRCRAEAGEKEGTNLDKGACINDLGKGTYGQNGVQTTRKGTARRAEKRCVVYDSGARTGRVLFGACRGAGTEQESIL